MSMFFPFGFRSLCVFRLKYVFLFGLSCFGAVRLSLSFGFEGPLPLGCFLVLSRVGSVSVLLSGFIDFPFCSSKSRIPERLRSVFCDVGQQNAE